MPAVFEQPSLMDSGEFLAELEDIEGAARQGLPGSGAFSFDTLTALDEGLDLHTPDPGDDALERRLSAGPRFIEPHTRPQTEETDIRPQPEASVGTYTVWVVLVMMSGLCGGAAAAALLLHERLAVLLR